ncbi:hypothetical protein NAP1_04640 [Erythrobacter sp. NAP1]|nr:hypothetical protein NAP1_04640 [Erythrobacter sp. NAP1]
MARWLYSAAQGRETPRVQIARFPEQFCRERRNEEVVTRTGIEPVFQP